MVLLRYVCVHQGDGKAIGLISCLVLWQIRSLIIDLFISWFCFLNLEFSLKRHISRDNTIQCDTPQWPVISPCHLRKYEWSLVAQVLVCRFQLCCQWNDHNNQLVMNDNSSDILEKLLFQHFSGVHQHLLHPRSRPCPCILGPLSWFLCNCYNKKHYIGSL